MELKAESIEFQGPRLPWNEYTCKRKPKLETLWENEK